MAEFNELLTEAGIPEEVAQQANDMFTQKLEEGIASGVEDKLAATKLEWAIAQAPKIEQFLEGVVADWVEANAARLDQLVESEVISESVGALRSLLGITTETMNESAVKVRDEKVAGLTGQVTQLSDSLNESHNIVATQAAEIKTLQESIAEYQRAEAFVELTEGLSVHATDKITQTLVGLHFTDLDAFKTAVTNLVETFKETPEPKSDEGVDAVDDEGATKPTNESAATGDKPMNLVEATLHQMRKGKAS